MTTLLCIDAGNSRINWQAREEGRAFAEGISPTAAPMLELPGSVVESIEACAISAVSSQTVVASIQGQLETLGLPLGMLLASQSCWGTLTNGYESPERMGVDRWLAMVAARRHADGPLVVVDAGTATTVDPIDAAGRHLGGFIVLGMRAMLTALGGATAGIEALPLQGMPRTPITRNTREAVLAGALQATRGLVERASNMLEQRCGRRPTVLVTGGDGRVLCAGEPAYHWRRDLVLEGIEIVARQQLADAHAQGTANHATRAVGD